MYILNTAAVWRYVGGGGKEERLKQHLEVGGQADDGQVSQLVPLCRGQLWQCGRSLCNVRHTARFSKRESQREEHTQVTSACAPFARAQTAPTSIITLKSFNTKARASESGAASAPFLRKSVSSG